MYICTMSINLSKLMTVSDYERLDGSPSRKTLYSYINQNKIPHKVIGGVTFIQTDKIK